MHTVCRSRATGTRHYVFRCQNMLSSYLICPTRRSETAVFRFDAAGWGLAGGLAGAYLQPRHHPAVVAAGLVQVDAALLEGGVDHLDLVNVVSSQLSCLGRVLEAQVHNAFLDGMLVVCLDLKASRDVRG